MLYQQGGLSYILQMIMVAPSGAGVFVLLRLWGHALKTVSVVKAGAGVSLLAAGARQDGGGAAPAQDSRPGQWGELPGREHCVVSTTEMQDRCIGRHRDVHL